MPKVSIVTPAYNSAKFISETIESVLSQTFQDFEMCIVDDGSTDETRVIVQRYERQYPGKIKYIRQDNGGSAKARNTGIRNSMGDFVAFVDADDLWLPLKLEKQMAFLEKNPGIDIVYTNATVISEQGEDKWLYVKPWEYQYKVEEMYPQLLLRNFIPLSSLVVRRQALANVGYFNETILYSEDSDLLMRLAKDYKIKYINEALAKYRVTSSNKSSNLEKRHNASLAVAVRNYDQKRVTLKFRFLFRRRCAKTRYYLGYVLFSKDRLAEARKEFLTSLSLWPFFYFRQYFYLLYTFIPVKALNQFKLIKRKLFKG